MSDSDSEDSVYGFNVKPRAAFQDNPTKCTVEWCQKPFDSKSQMQIHKVNDPEHFYCKKCDVDCEDYEDLIAHKVDSMAPFVEGRMSKKDEKPVHIVCEFCGQDFQSLDGRKRHREISHPADQNIKCPGCSLAFIRAAHMIAHLEDNKCQTISAHQFLSCIHHKWIIKQVMEDHVHFQDAIASNQQAVPKMDHLQQVTDGFETLDVEDGGVSLLDQHDEAQMGGYKPLEPEVDLMGSHTPAVRGAPAESWPSLMNAKANMLATSEATSRRGGNKVLTEDNASSGTPVSVWANGNASKALFKGAGATPAAGNWQDILATRAAETTTNLLTQFWWQPGSQDYDVSRFWSPLLETYRCPFPACDADSLSFEVPSEIEAHIRSVHFLQMYRCLNCYKRFERPSALISHVESTRKCSVQNHSKFEQFIHEITGGFLQAEPVGHKQPLIFRHDMSVVKASEPMPVGIKKIEFTSTRPM